MTDIDIKVPAIEKLIDVAASGTGAVAGPLLLPYKAKMQAKAGIIEAKGKAQAMKIIAQAEADSIKFIAQAQAKAKGILTRKQDTDSTNEIQTDIKMDTENLIQIKTQFQERKRLSNLQNIIVQAKEKLPDQVNNKPVDPDWTARFFQSAQDVSTKEMQQIWSSILAGEVETPGRTSLRTLDILRNMTKKEAETFNQLMRYKIRHKMEYKTDDFVVKDIGLDIEFEDVLTLKDLGLVSNEHGLTISIPFRLTVYNTRLKYWSHDPYSVYRPNDHIQAYRAWLEHWDHILLIRGETSSKKKIDFPIIHLTNPAKELAGFLNHKADFNYLKKLSQYLNKKYFYLKVAKKVEGRGLCFYDKDTKPIGAIR